MTSNGGFCLSADRSYIWPFKMQTYWVKSGIIDQNNVLVTFSQNLNNLIFIFQVSKLLSSPVQANPMPVSIFIYIVTTAKN